MSVLHAVAQATLAPSPTLSPAVQAVKTVVVTKAAAPAPTLPGLTDLLNNLAKLLAPYVVVIGAVVASSIQVFLNKLPWLQNDVAKLQDLYRRLMAAALPILGTFLAGLATGQNTLHLAPWIFLVSQILYSAVQALKASGGAQFMDQTLAAEENAAG